MLRVFSLDFLVAEATCRLVTINSRDRGDPQKRMYLQHSHSGFEIHYVRSGLLTMDCIGAGYRLSAGQVLIIPPGIYHNVRSVSGDIDRMNMLIEVRRGTDPEQCLQGLFSSQLMHLQQDRGNEALFAVMDKLELVAEDSQMGDFLQQQWLKVLCMELVLLMAAVTKDHQAEEAATAFDGVGLNPDRYIMDQFFNHNYHRNSGMEELAKKLNMSVRQTGRVLQKTYGKGFREKMNECRLAVALDLLRNTCKPISEISEILGYGEATNFSCFVKRQTGKTPAEIRKGRIVNDAE